MLLLFHNAISPRSFSTKLITNSRNATYGVRKIAAFGDESALRQIKHIKCCPLEAKLKWFGASSACQCFLPEAADRPLFVTMFVVCRLTCVEAPSRVQLSRLTTLGEEALFGVLCSDGYIIFIHRTAHIFSVASNETGKRQPSPAGEYLYSHGFF